MEGRALLFVGPDGSGRHTLSEAIGITLQIPRVVSYTTRPKREKETEGKEYFYISTEAFKAMEENGEFIEIFISDGIHYGIKKADCERLLKDYGSFFAILSPEGCEMFKKLFDKTLTIFIYADRDTVTQRQFARGDDQQSVDRHLSHYDEIMSYQSECDIAIPNYDLASTAQELTNRIETFLGISHHPDSKY